MNRAGSSRAGETHGGFVVEADAAEIKDQFGAFNDLSSSLSRKALPNTFRQIADGFRR